MSTIGTHVDDSLIAGDFPIATKAITLLSGENLTRGAILGQITTGGKYKGCDITLSDGAEVPDAILAQDTDASAADAETVGYLTGEMNANDMTVSTAGGASVLGLMPALRNKSIFVRTPVIR